MSIKYVRLYSMIALMAGAASIAPQAIASEYEKLAFLTGCWAHENGANSMSENWSDQGGGQMLGVAKTVKDGILQGFEFLTITANKKGATYVPYINGKEKAPFHLAEVSSNRALFINPKNDFPQTIDYVLSEDALHITLMGDGPEFSYSLAAVSCRPASAPR